MEPEIKEVVEKESKQTAMAKYKEIAVIVVLVGMAIICFYFLLFRFASVQKTVGGIIRVFSPILVGFIFAYILNPVVMFLEKKFLGIRKWYLKKKSEKAPADSKKPAKESKIKKFKNSHGHSDDNADVTNQNSILTPERRTARKLAILVTIVGAISLITLLVMNVIPAFANSIAALAEKFPEYYAKIQETVINFINRHEWISKNIPNVNDIFSKFNVMEFVNNYLDEAVNKAYNGVLSIFRFVYNLVVGLIVAMYILGGKERYIAQIKKMLFAFMKPGRAQPFINNMKKTNQIFKSAILGKILDSILIGCICFIGMSILGMFGFEAIETNRVLISMIVGVTNVIPFFGPYIGGVPSVLLLLFVQPASGIAFAIFIVCLQQFDMNFLDPRVVGKSVGLSPFYVLCSCLLAGGFFGIGGIVIGSPTGAVIYGIIKSYSEAKLASKNLPLETQEYAAAAWKQ